VQVVYIFVTLSRVQCAASFHGFVNPANGENDGGTKMSDFNSYCYIKHLRIGGSIFYDGKFLLYLFYLSIRRIIFIID
jgi:hypothetical protein